MEKIFYNKDGWVCERYPYDLQVDDENRYIEVDKETYEKTLSCNKNFCWRVVDGVLTEERYQENTPEELNALKAIQLKAELAQLKEDIEQENFGLVRDDFAKKKARAAEIINELRVLEGKKPREVKQ